MAGAGTRSSQNGESTVARSGWPPSPDVGQPVERADTGAGRRDREAQIAGHGTRQPEGVDTGGQQVDGGQRPPLRSGRGPWHQSDELAQLGHQIVQDGLGDRAAVVEVDGDGQLDLAAVAGGREVGGSEDDPGRALPHQHRDLGVEQTAAHDDREHVPSQVPLVGRAAAIDQHRHLRLAEPVLLLQHGGDRGDCVALAGDGGQAEEP